MNAMQSQFLRSVVVALIVLHAGVASAQTEATGNPVQDIGNAVKGIFDLIEGAVNKLTGQSANPEGSKPAAEPAVTKESAAAREPVAAKEPAAAKADTGQPSNEAAPAPSAAAAATPPQTAPAPASTNVNPIVPAAIPMHTIPSADTERGKPGISTAEWIKMPSSAYELDLKSIYQLTDKNKRQFGAFLRYTNRATGTSKYDGIRVDCAQRGIIFFEARNTYYNDFKAQDVSYLAATTFPKPKPDVPIEGASVKEVCARTAEAAAALPAHTAAYFPVKAEPGAGNYEGPIVNNAYHGKGTMTWPNGNRYEGDFVEGQRNGKGVFVWANGNRYEGDFLNGNRIGKGAYTRPNGERYEGEWLMGNLHGSGSSRLPNGDQFVGEFRDNKYWNGRLTNSAGHVTSEYSEGVQRRVTQPPPQAAFSPAPSVQPTYRPPAPAARPAPEPAESRSDQPDNTMEIASALLGLMNPGTQRRQPAQAQPRPQAQANAGAWTLPQRPTLPGACRTEVGVNSSRTICPDGTTTTSQNSSGQASSGQASGSGGGATNSAPVNSLNQCLRQSRGEGACGKANGHLVEMRNVCGQRIKATLCLEQRNGLGQCGSNGALDPNETILQYVCDGTGRYKYWGCEMNGVGNCGGALRNEKPF